MLEVERLSRPIALRDVSFTCIAARCSGVAGLVGAGRSELGAALFGLDRIRGGASASWARRFQPRSPRDAMRRGIGLVPEDRRTEGLMMSMSVRKTRASPRSDRIDRLGFLRVARAPGTRGGVAAGGAAVRLARQLRQPSERRQSAEGAAGALAAASSRSIIPGRPHARHRRRRQAGHLSHDRGTLGRREGGDAGELGIARAAALLPSYSGAARRPGDGHLRCGGDATQEKIMAAATLAEAHA
jgi:hypothetical protein